MNSVLINQMLQLFIMIAAGYVLFKLKYMDVTFNGKLTKLLLDVTLPLLILNSVMNPEGERDYSAIGTVFLVSFCLYVFLITISILLVKLLRFPPKQQGMYMFMHTFSNTAFMGFPIINALYGNKAMLYTAILNIFFNLFAYTIGIIMVGYKGKLEGGPADLIKQMNPKHLISPGTIMSLLSIGVYFMPITFPTVVKGVCASIGGLTSPLAMLLIGATLAKMPVKNIFNDWRVYLFALVKQLLIPLAVWPLMKLVISDEFIRSIMFVLFLMPIANTAVLFATRHGNDEELAAKNVFVTTLLALITIPLCIGLFL